MFVSETSEELKAKIISNFIQSNTAARIVTCLRHLPSAWTARTSVRLSTMEQPKQLRVTFKKLAELVGMVSNLEQSYYQSTRSFSASKCLAVTRK